MPFDVIHRDEGDTFAVRLRQARLLRGLSGAELAERLGLARGQQYISMIERGCHQNLTIGRVSQISEALDVDPRWLAFGGDAAPEGITQVSLKERRPRVRPTVLAA